jgi:hypothetical protein
VCSVHKLEITDLVRAADELLRTTGKPRHRRMIENYRRRALLEVTGQWRRFLTPDMTVEHPVYHLDVDGMSLTIDGYGQVAGFHQSLADSGSTVVVLENEQLAVADWGLASEATFNTYLSGTAIPDADPNGFYVRRQLIAVLWPYDEHERVLGEHVYGHSASSEVIEVNRDEFITLEDARAALIPLIRPLA